MAVVVARIAQMLRYDPTQPPVISHFTKCINEKLESITDGARMDKQTDRWMDGQLDGWTDGRTDRWTKYQNTDTDTDFSTWWIQFVASYCTNCSVNDKFSSKHRFLLSMTCQFIFIASPQRQFASFYKTGFELVAFTDLIPTSSSPIGDFYGHIER